MARPATMNSKQKKAYKKLKADNLRKEIKTLGLSTMKSKGGTPDAKPNPTLVLKRINLSDFAEHERDNPPEMSSLSDTRHCTNHKCLASVVGAMVAHGSNYDRATQHELLSQFSYYFDKLGWETEENMIALTHDNLPRP